MGAARTIAFVASDPGGANALLPVMHRLAGLRGARILVWPYAQSVEIWQNGGYAVQPVEENLDLERAVTRLRKNRVDLLVTGTSLNALEVEKKFVTAAGILKIPSLAVLDFYSNYVERFSDRRGPFSCLPERVAVMDEYTRTHMVELGAPAERIVVTGQPAFDQLTRMRRDSRRAERDELDVKVGEKLVCFISQPMLEMYGSDASHPRYPGYDQHTALQQLLPALETLAAQGKRLVLAVRIHPRENAAWFNGLSARGVRVHCLSDGPALRAVHASDLVVGMTSTMLVEALYLGRIALSLQPGLCLPQTIPAIEMGWIPLVTNPEQVTPVVRELLYDPRRRRDLHARFDGQAEPPDSQSTRRVLELIETMLLWRR